MDDLKSSLEHTDIQLKENVGGIEKKQKEKEKELERIQKENQERLDEQEDRS